MSKANNYTLQFSASVSKTYQKYIKNNLVLQKAFKKTRDTIADDPFYAGLHTHKVDTIQNNDVYSSIVTGDWRIIWQFDKETKVATILVLELGTHSGSSQVYQNKS